VYSHEATPHSCGELCSKERLKDCSHPCNILCHPGPCPPCQAFVSRLCLCGKTGTSMKCSDSASYKCEGTCEKTRNCGRHSCNVGCHAGGCDPCVEQVEQVCFCTKLKRRVVCGSSEAFVNSFACERVCGRRLECGEHDCMSVCHPGLCGTCALLPSVVTHCSCGRTQLENIKGVVPRTSCTDAIATCDEICDKLLGCGNLGRS